MTLLAGPPLWTGHGLSLRMTHITRRAEKQVKKLLSELSRDDREKLFSDLLRSVPYDRRDKITDQERHGLSHYRARCRGAVRICFCRLNGPDVVILDVARHDPFDKFAKNFTGTYGTYIPIEESQVMSKHQSNGISAAAPTAAMPYQNVAEILARLLIGSQAFEARAKSIDDTIVKFMDDARDAAVGKVEGELENIEGRLTGQEYALRKLQGVVIGLRGELTAVSEGMVVHRGEVDVRLEAQRAGLAAVAIELVEAIAKCDRGITTITAAVRNVEEGLGDFVRRMDDARDGAITKIEGRIAGQGTAIEKLQGAVAGLQGEMSTVNTTMAAHRGDVVARLEAQRVSLSSIDDRLAGAIAKCDRDNTTITADVRNVEEGLRDFGRRVETRLDAITLALAEDRMAPLTTRLDRLAADKEQLIQCLGEQDARLAGTDDALATCRDEVAALHASLNDLVARMDREGQERGRRTLKARWLGFVAAVRSAFDAMMHRRFNN